MARIYLLDKTLNILAEASSYELIYEAMISKAFASIDTIVSYNPPTASLLMWKGQPLD